uniref:Proline and serine rich 2 n=1 Tax=Echeneis naucrates TaxID=173247 RepID=A0A665UMN6_ECHNA
RMLERGGRGNRGEGNFDRCVFVLWSRQEDNALLCLSQEEQECIQFFEDTIGSLEKSLQDDEHKAGQAKPVVSGRQEVDGPVTSSPLMARSLSPKDQDIIDLVHPEPAFNHASPGNVLQLLMGPTPESHFDIKPRRDSTDNLPSEYNPPLPSGSYGPTDQSSYQPTGCIPTPVLIAQKIAENKASGSSSLLPSVVLHRRSIESENPPDHPVKQGPPTSAKPSRFPANINMIHGNKEHQNQSLANVNIYERRAQMLANLTGTSHVAVTRNDLPDILSSHVGTSQMLPAKTELNSYGGKSRTINPSAGLNRSPESHTKSVRAPAPAPAPRPPRHSYHGAVAPLKTAQQALSPDHRRKSASMFRPQGITVQFSGRGATNESRREALKKLGLLKDS